MLARLLARRVEIASDAGLAQVVDAGPDEFADDVGVFHDLLPRHRRVARVRLGVENDALGEALVVAFGEPFEIVVADDVEIGGHRVLIRPMLAPEAQGLRDGAGWIEFAAFRAHLRRRFGRGAFVAL